MITTKQATDVLSKVMCVYKKFIEANYDECSICKGIGFVQTKRFFIKHEKRCSNCFGMGFLTGGL